MLACYALHEAFGDVCVGAGHRSRRFYVARRISLVLRVLIGVRADAAALCLRYTLKARDRDYATEAVQRIAGFEPIQVVLAGAQVREVTLREAERIWVVRPGTEKSFDDLWNWIDD